VKDISLREPTEEEWKTIAETFEKRAQFPNCIGAVDGKHIRIKQPPHSGSLYYNYKRFFSVVLLAICDADYKFISIDVGAYGKCSDSSIFKESAIYEKLVKKELKIPDKCPISTTNDTPMPYVFVGDEAFPLLQNLMRPYPGNNLSHEKKIFNYRLSRARRYIECTFGILANKWRIFHRPLDVHTDFAIDIVKACCVLHNFIRTRDGIRHEDSLHSFPSHQTSRDVTRNTRQPVTYRDFFAQYFVGDGQVPWQNKCIM
jgi:hypothetical protein